MRRLRLVFAAARGVAVAWIAIGAAACGQATDALQLGDATTTEEAATTTSSTAAISAAPIDISGDAVLERPQGKVLFAAEWGSGEGEFGYDLWEQGVPSQNPIELSVSQDNKTIAILDYANRRVQVYSYEGALQRVVPISTKAGLADVAFGQDGSIYVLTYGDSVVQIPPDGGGKAVECTIAAGIWPQELIVDGAAVWAKGAEGGYQLISGRTPLSPEE